MMTSYHDMRRAELLKAEERIRNQLRQLADSPPSDMYDDGTVLIVNSRYYDGRVRTYALLKVAQKWYCTGNRLSGGVWTSSPFEDWDHVLSWLLRRDVESSTIEEFVAASDFDTVKFVNSDDLPAGHYTLRREGEHFVVE